MRSKIQGWWDESDRQPVRDVDMRSRGEAGRSQQQRWQRKHTFPTACWEDRRRTRTRAGARDEVRATSTDRTGRQSRIDADDYLVSMAILASHLRVPIIIFPFKVKLNGESIQGETGKGSQRRHRRGKRMEVAQGWLKTESRAVAKGLWGPALPARTGTGSRCSVRPLAALPGSIQDVRGPSTVLKRHSGLNPGWAASIQYFKRLERSNTFFKTQNTHLKRDLSARANDPPLRQGKRGKGSRCKCSCLKRSRYRGRTSWEAQRQRVSSAWTHGMTYKPAGAGEAALTEHGHPGPRACARLTRGSGRDTPHLLFGNRKIHVGCFKLGLELGSGGRGPLRVIWPLGTVLCLCLSFRNEGGYVMRTPVKGRG